ncbi:DUF1080 domain-containing protein [Ancylomarina sp. 16SWW S1-10-2]|uniref:3-keto-disaccharide hydrolase n=1 Tax=Ancylomarina sp. 16SWW S1-10-2 TaxID=2499681 RepID=UPI0012AD8067|nr:DUF1080 domain-containing protein [Ancylomarina sp. 16SWW S1-10-2]MRT93790.1 DUF1080 domain-containing protein [Ancylomarina sp. 16SWW S1-10-2]
MRKKILILQWVLITCFANPIFAQVKLKELSDFREPIGNWVKAGKVEMDSQKPESLIYKSGSKCFVNGENGKAKYLVSKNEYQDMEFHTDFMLPKGSNSGIYFMCRYELQLFDSWGETDLTYYDCGGIQNRWDKSTDVNKRGYNGFAPMVNACKAPGEWQSLDIIFRAPKFNKEGEKVKNASFDKVILNGIVVQENVDLTVPTRGAISGEEVAKAPFRLQGGHGPVAYRNIKVKDLEHTTK